MKLNHFEKLKPVCPRCLRDRNLQIALEIGSAIRQKSDSICEGILLCPQSDCLMEYPIINGLPIIVADLRAYVTQHILPILQRGDLSADIESLLGDCCGPNSAFDTQRQHLSIYAQNHYGDMDPEADNDSAAQEESVLNLLDKGLELAGERTPGPIVDTGCSVGRSTFALAEKSNDLVLGIDMSFSMIKVAAKILNEGVASYPRRRVGMVYDQREFPLEFAGSEKVDFWICDATALPFADDRFSFAASLNILDCLHLPYDHLKTLARVLVPGGKTVIATPYDWSAAATPVESWIGGHSQRSANKGSSEAMLRSLFAGGGHPNAIQDLHKIGEIERLPWTAKLHDRSVVHYQVHLLAAQRAAGPGSLK